MADLRKSISPTAHGAHGFSIRTERLDACPLCNSPDTRPWRSGCVDWQQPELAQRFDFCRCRGCGVRFLSRRPVESDLWKAYFAGYGPHQPAQGDPDRPPVTPRPSRTASAASAALGMLPPARLPRRLGRFYSPERPGLTLLDYGCGAPTFLDEARSRGWRTLGVDFAENLLEPLRAHGHDAYLVGEDFEQGVPDASLSCVRLNHVIEHLYEPRRALSQLRRKTRSGGRIHLATPNPLGIGAHVFRRCWAGLECPRHSVLYPPRVLCALLIEAGFRHPRLVFEGSAKDFARSWGIFLHASRRIRRDQIVPMAVDPARIRRLVPLARLTGPTRLAERYHVFAES